MDRGAVKLRDPDGRPFKMNTGKEKREYQRRWRKRFAELDQDHQALIAELNLEQGRLEYLFDLRKVVDDRYPKEAVAAFERYSYCWDLVQKLWSFAPEPDFQGHWLPEFRVKADCRRFEIEDESSAPREPVGVSDDDDLVFEEHPPVAGPSGSLRNSPLEEIAISSESDSATPGTSRGRLPTPIILSGSDSDSGAMDIDEQLPSRAAPIGSGGFANSDSDSDSGEEADNDDFRQPLRVETPIELMSEKRRGKQRAFSAVPDADPVQLPTPRPSTTRSVSTSSKALLVKPKLKTKPRPTKLKTEPIDLGPARVKTVDEKEYDLRGNLKKKSKRGGGGSKKAVTKKVLVNEIRTTFNPKRQRILPVNPCSETRLHERISPWIQNSSRKIEFDFVNFRVTSQDGPIDLVDLFNFDSGYEIEGMAELPCREEESEVAVKRELETPKRQLVRLYPQDRPRLTFTLRQGFVIETRKSRFVLQRSAESFAPFTKSARTLLNVWVLARESRIRGAYSNKEEDVEEVADTVRAEIRKLLDSARNVHGRLRWPTAKRYSWYWRIPGEWRCPVQDFRLEEEHERLLFELLPNIPFVVPQVYKSISPFLLPNSIRTDGDPKKLDNLLVAEREQDRQLLEDLTQRLRAWDAHDGDFYLTVSDPISDTALHPLSRTPVRRFRRVTVHERMYRVGDVVQVYSSWDSPGKKTKSRVSPLDTFDLPSDDEEAGGGRNRTGSDDEAVPFEGEEEKERDWSRSLWFARIESIFLKREEDEEDLEIDGDIKPSKEEDVSLHVTYFTTSNSIPSLGPYASPRQLFLLDLCTTISASSLVSKIDYKELKPGDSRPSSKTFYCSSLYDSEKSGSFTDLPTSNFEYCRRAEIPECVSCEADLIFAEATSRASGGQSGGGGYVAANKVWTPIRLDDDERGSFRYAGRQYHVNDFVLLSPQVTSLPDCPTSTERRNPLRLAQIIEIEADSASTRRSRGVTDLGKRAKLKVRWIIRRSETSEVNGTTIFEREVFLTEFESSGIDVNRLEGRFYLNHLDVVRRLSQGASDLAAIAEYERQDPLNFFFTSKLYRKDGNNLAFSEYNGHERIDARIRLKEIPVGREALVSCRICLDEERDARERRMRVEKELDRSLSASHFDSLSLYSGAGGLDLGLGIGCKALRTTQAVELNKEAASVFRSNHETRNVTVGATSDFLEDVFYGRRERTFFASITAGAPCQGFSFSNMYKRVDDLRCLEPFVFLSALATFRPLYATFENVQGFLSHALPEPKAGHPSRGSFFQLFIATALDLGYQLRWSLVQSAAYGVPQSRRRFIVQFALRGVPLPRAPSPTHAFANGSFVFDHSLREQDWVKSKIDRTSSGYAPNPSITVEEAIDDLPPFSVKELFDRKSKMLELRTFGYPWSEGRSSKATYPSAQPNTSFQLRSRAQPLSRIDPSTSGTGENGGRGGGGIVFSRSATHHICSAPSELYYKRLVALGIKGQDGKFGNYKDFQELDCQVHVPDWLERASEKRREMFWSRLAPDSIVATLRTSLNIDASSHGPRIHWEQARWLSLRELMRIQGLPDSFEMRIDDAEPDTALADIIRIIGNGVPVPLAEAFGRSLAEVVYPLIDSHLSSSPSDDSSGLFERIWRENCGGNRMIGDSAIEPATKTASTTLRGGRAGGFARDDEDSSSEQESDSDLEIIEVLT